MIARAMGFVGFHNSGKTTLLVRRIDIHVEEA